MQIVLCDITAHSVKGPALQEGLVTDVAAAVLQIALLNTAILSVNAL